MENGEAWHRCKRHPHSHSTLVVGWMLRDSMMLDRSNDAWWGLPTVIHCFPGHKMKTRAPKLRTFTMWCYAERSYATYHDHTGWNTSKIISLLNSLRYVLRLTQHWQYYPIGTAPKFVWNKISYVLSNTVSVQSVCNKPDNNFTVQRRIPHFRYHCNKGRSQEKFTDTVKLANPLNRWSGARFCDITVIYAQL